MLYSGMDKAQSHFLCFHDSASQLLELHFVELKVASVYFGVQHLNKVKLNVV